MGHMPNDLSLLSDTNRAWLAQPRKLLIGSSWVESESGQSFAVRDPSSGREVTRAQQATTNDVDAAVKAARKAFDEGAWPKTKPAERGRMLWKLADLMEQHGAELAQLEALDNGKPVGQATHIDLAMSVNFVRYIAGFATKVHGRTFDLSVPYAPEARFHAYTLREPVGVVGAIIPWNMPMLMAVWKLCPALATGCTIVLKPASDTPLTAIRIGELVQEAGFPEGVVNIITGPGGLVGDALVKHPGVDKIAFTGSTEIGKAIGKGCMDSMKRVSLELGGKSPVIVLDDADLEMAIPGIMLGIFANCGQVCSAGSRLYVQKGLHDPLLAALEQATKSMKVGPGLDWTSELGPMVSNGQRRTVQEFVASGIAEGAELVAGGKELDTEGYYVEPTVFANTNHNMKIVREEIFGPVLAVQSFDTVDEAIRLANDSPFGLASAVYSTSNSRINEIVPKIKAGTVWVNCHNIFDAALPFGGYKESGIGREMGPEVMDMYTEVKSVCQNY